MSLLEDVLHGALASGTNNATLLVLNVCLLAFIFVGASLFALPLPPQLLPHIAFLLVLAVGLLVAVNWLIAQTGTVSPAEQQRELFGSPEAAAGVGSSGAQLAADQGEQAPKLDRQREAAIAAAAEAEPKSKDQ